MRARVAGAFALGFAVGALCLAVVSWRTGALKTSVIHPYEKPAPQAPAGLPDLSQPAPPLPHNPLPPEEPPQAGSSASQGRLPSQGEAERTAPTAGEPRISMPIAGIDPKTLTDTFNQTRDGHRHEALDIMSPRGTPVVAADEGNVVKLFTSKPGGLTVYQFDDSETWCYYYAHLDRYARGLREGMLLRRGDMLGYVGSTGDADPNPPHLHFAIFRLDPDKKWWHGTAIDPLPLLLR